MEFKLQKFYQNVVLDIAVSFYVRGFIDSGKSEEEALKQFMVRYVQKEIEDTTELLECYMKLKKLLSQQKNTL